MFKLEATPCQFGKQDPIHILQVVETETPLTPGVTNRWPRDGMNGALAIPIAPKEITVTLLQLCNNLMGKIAGIHQVCRDSHGDRLD